MHYRKITQKDVNEVKQQQETEAKHLQKSGWLVKTYKPERYFRDIESNPENKFLEIHNITLGNENGTTFKISIEKQKYCALFDTRAEINGIKSVALEQLDFFDKIYNSNILVCNASRKMHGCLRKSNTETWNKWEKIHTIHSS